MSKSARGHPLESDEAVTFGPRRIELTGVSVAWVANEQAIAAAAAAGHNCLIHHESLNFPYPGLGYTGNERHFLSWEANHSRLSALARHGITAIRIHGSLDELYIYEAFAAQLGLGGYIAQDPAHITYRVYASPVPTLGELIEHVKRSIGMSAIRATCEAASRPVKRIGLPWGGLGLFVNVSYMQRVIDLGVDTFICGETDNYGFRFAAESGVAMIETSHEISEAKGLEEFAAELGPALGIDCRLVPTPCIWKVR